MRRYTVFLGLVFFFAASSRSEIFFDHFDRAPEFRPFEGFEWNLRGQLPANAVPPLVDKVLTIEGTAPDVNKDGFVTDNGSGPAEQIGSSDPMGYEALHSNSLWGNVRVILGLPFYHRADSEISAPDGEGGGSIVPSPSVAAVPEPASLSLLCVGAAGVMRRRRR